MSLWIKCKGATELASRAMDQPLPLHNRIALKLHHLVCAHCARYAKQLHEIRRLLRRETASDTESMPALSLEAKRRIETELHKKLDS
ncbi:MAG: anti-sigma factor family protein [Thiobacillus sp.]